MRARSLQQRLIIRIRRVQRDHVGNRQALVVASEPLDHIPGTEVTFSIDREIEPAAATLQKSLDHVGAPETNRELVAGHARLRDNEFCRTHPVAIANPHLIFQKALRREILSKTAPGQIRIRKFTTPEIVMLDWVSVDGFLRSAVDRKIRLLVAVDVAARDVDAIRYRRLEDRGLDTIPLPLHLSRPPDADRHDLHGDVRPVSVAIQLTSYVLPPSSENDCSKRQEVAVMSLMTNRTKMARSLSVSWPENSPRPFLNSPIAGVPRVPPPLLAKLRLH